MEATAGSNGVVEQHAEDHRVRKLESEKAELLKRLEFVEELVGPTEAQRKAFQEQVLAARSAALKAKYRGASVPTKVAGRLDERLMWSCGLSEHDVGLLQGGCLPDKEGILQDVSLLGDPRFQPYNQQTGETRWTAKGGVLQLSMDEVQTRFGEEVALDVVRCAKELDKYDASRRVGIELPWHPLEDRELEPAEVISLMDRELSMQASMLYLDDRDPTPLSVGAEGATEHHDHHLSPYAVVNAPPPRGSRGRRGRAIRTLPTSLARCARGARSGSAGSSVPENAVVPLPRVDPVRRGVAAAQELRCGLPGRRARIQDALDHPLLGCHNRVFAHQ